MRTVLARATPQPGDPETEWQKPVAKDRSEARSWLGVGKRGASQARESSKAPRTFESLGDEWLEGVRSGRIS